MDIRAGRPHAGGNIHTGGRLANGPERGPMPSCRLAPTGQKKPGLGLKNGHELAGHDVELVLVAFSRGQLPFVALPGQRGNPRVGELN